MSVPGDPGLRQTSETSHTNLSLAFHQAAPVDIGLGAFVKALHFYTHRRSLPELKY